MKTRMQHKEDIEMHWNNLVQKHNAIHVRGIEFLSFAPKDKAVWFETTNFAWIMSEVDDHGKRTILERF